MRFKTLYLSAAVAIGTCSAPGQSANDSAIPHLKKHGAAMQLVIGGKPFLVLGGELHNSTSSTLDYLEPIWPKLAEGHLNTVLAPISWELLEPEEGKFDFTVVDGLVQAARKRNLRLILLWFGTWKNMNSSYAPLWVRTDPVRFACVLDRDGNRLPIVTPLSEAARDADKKAFAALMKRVRQLDQGRSDPSVLMIQVQNEVGLPGGSRDMSAAANQSYKNPVPRELMDRLIAGRENLPPQLRQAWDASGARTSGTWEEIFGDGKAGSEIFMAWHYARYIGAVIAAGKAEYPLPMFVNASVGRSDGALATYPSGGPIAYVSPVWFAAAPQLDMLSPDIYYGDFAAWCRKYVEAGNPLFIPEMRMGKAGVVNALTAIGRYNAIGVSPFGIENLIAGDADYARLYGMLSGMSSLILAHQGDDSMAFVALDQTNTLQQVPIGRYTFHFETASRRNATPETPESGQAGPQNAYALVVREGIDEFFVLGRNIQITFSPNPPANEVAAAASIDEGRFVNGKWLPGRRLNGDEIMLSYSFSGNAAKNQTGTGARFNADEPSIYRVKLVRYAGSKASP